MDFTEMNYQEMFFQTGNLHRRIPQATQVVQSWNPQAYPTYRYDQYTGTSVAGAASSHQSSNILCLNMLSGFTDGSIVAAPETGHRNVREASVPTYMFHTDPKHHHTDAHNQACQSGTEPWQTLQMEIGYPTTGESQESHRLWFTKVPQVDFPMALYMHNADADAPSEAPNCQENDAPYYDPVLPCHQTQRYHDSPFQGGPEGYPHYGDPPSLVLLSVHGAASTVAPRDSSSSLHPTTTLVSYPSREYDLVSDTNAVAANTRVIGSKMEIGDTVSSRFMPMSNYQRTPAFQLLQLPPSETTQHMSNGFDHLAGFKVARSISLESQQIVWDRTTGNVVLTRGKRSLSDAERAHSRKIRKHGGQCKKCKKNKRKCDISHLRARSAASATSHSARTCSSESSFVLPSTHKRRKSNQFDVHAQRSGQSLEAPCVGGRHQGTHSVSGRSPSREDRSESIAGAMGSADIPSSSEPGTMVLGTVDLGSANFSQDNLAWGGQFSPRLWFSGSFTPESLDLNSAAASPIEPRDLAGC